MSEDVTQLTKRKTSLLVYADALGTLTKSTWSNLNQRVSKKYTFPMQ